MIKTRDEITLLNTACAMVDAAYEELYRDDAPGMRENECVGARQQGRSTTWAPSSSRASTRSRASAASPHPHVYTDRALRPGDPAYFDILHSYMGYRTCYYRTFAVGSASRALVDAYKRCRYYLDAAIELIRPGATTGEVVSGVAARRRSSASPTRRRRSRSSSATASGSRSGRSRSSAASSRSTTPRRSSEGMVFALETFWPASDGWSAARIEEQLVVTADGCEVITRFPAEDLVIAGKPYYTVGGSLPLERESPPSATRCSTTTPRRRSRHATRAHR